MSEQAQTLATAAAQSASEAVTALLIYAREGGAIDEGAHYDMLYPLAVSARTAIEAINAANRAIPVADAPLLSALIQWINWSEE
jgi:hypothetical protein